jgi:acetyltransferase-like isoleucine patch superfamily enzyme
MDQSRITEVIGRARSELEAMRDQRHRETLAARARAVSALRLARARGKKVSWGAQVLFHEGFPILRGDGEFLIGDRCTFRYGPIRTRLATGPEGRLILGEHVGINFGCEIYAGSEVEIGEDTKMGSLVTIYDTNFHQVEEGAVTKSAPVRIGADAWLARGCVILPGVTIGDHAVIGAGAVISRDVPPRMLMAGNPAKPVRELKASETWRRQ